MSTSNSWQTTLVASTEQHNGWPNWFDWIVIENLGSTPVWVATDGTAATVDGADLDVCPANSTVVVPNRQPRLEPLVTVDGDTLMHLPDPVDGSETYISLISSGTPQVVVSPQ